ncbi:CDP-glycerol glycerophosphotransferase family protein [Oryzobacter sp. R7]|uniref:CDP-glycerol glycerophosphotransferase family protein n=1 Tax=Oryzobacter faecalis TaxID=3388656 RepID=UPI00398D4675
MADAARVLRGAGRLPRRAALAAVGQWRQSVRQLPIRRHVVLYEAFGGRGMHCHPEAIFRTLLDAEDLLHLEHVWVLDDLSRHPDLLRAWKDHPRVSFVTRDSLAYARELSTAGFLVNNATFPAYFGKRAGQVYLNTWHGTPLKRMGYDEPGGIAATRNVVRNFLMCDYVVSGSPAMTRQMYESAYRLVNVYRGRVLEVGNPRTDRMFEEDARATARAALRKAGVRVTDEQRLVLVAPTWRGASFAEPDDVSEDLRRQVEEIEAALPEGHRVLLKVHQQVHALVAANPATAGLIVPNDLPANLVLAAADVLVTDFSSIYYDALPTGLPVVFLTPDLDHYRSTRGLYLDVDELPGPVVTEPAEAARLVAAVGSGDADDPLVTHAERYATARATWAPRDDGGATRRLIDVVFRRKEVIGDSRETTRDGRTTLLIYLGGMKANGITASALNLLRNIDHSRFDVTVLHPYADTGVVAASAAAIPHEVRRLARVGGFNTGVVNRIRRQRLLDHGGRMTPRDMQTMLHLLSQEWMRCVGGARFDHLVDFSGYSPFWTFLMAEAPTRSRSIWMHNDLLADQMREVDGVRPYEKHLGAVFSAYRYYDHLVSVSPALRDINARNLAQYAPAEKFVAARNAIDAERVRAGAAPDPAAEAAWPGDHLFEPLDPDVPNPTAADLAAQHGVPELEHEITRRLALRHAWTGEDEFTFVAVGRVSPEKNHERLVRAFARVHAEHPNARLVVIGDGPLRTRNVALAGELGVGDAVRFTGLLENPWALMATCDAFVLSSDYEGQPMVILEALVLGLPVVSTSFGSVRDALPDGTGVVVERTVDDLAAGMAQALRGEVPNPPFDAAEYNATVMDEFARAIGATS